MAETTVKSGESEKRKKQAETFAHFLKAGRMGRGVWRTEKFRPAERIKQQRKSVDGRIPRDERVEKKGKTCSGQDLMEEGGQFKDRNME